MKSNNHSKKLGAKSKYEICSNVYNENIYHKCKVKCSFVSAFIRVTENILHLKFTYKTKSK